MRAIIESINIISCKLSYKSSESCISVVHRKLVAIIGGSWKKICPKLRVLCFNLNINRTERVQRMW